MKHAQQLAHVMLLHAIKMKLRRHDCTGSTLHAFKQELCFNHRFSIFKPLINRLISRTILASYRCTLFDSIENGIRRRLTVKKSRK